MFRNLIFMQDADGSLLDFDAPDDIGVLPASSEDPGASEQRLQESAAAAAAGKGKSK